MTTATQEAHKAAEAARTRGKYTPEQFYTDLSQIGSMTASEAQDVTAIFHQLADLVPADARDDFYNVTAFEIGEKSVTKNVTGG